MVSPTPYLFLPGRTRDALTFYGEIFSCTLADGGRVIDELQERSWGATDGQVIDRYGLHWLIGFEPDAPR